MKLQDFEKIYHPENDVPYAKATELEWSLFLAVKELSDRVVKLETELKEVRQKAEADEAAPKLTLVELAKVWANYDTDICPFCEKGDRTEYHQEKCPFTLTHQVLAGVTD